LRDSIFVSFFVLNAFLGSALAAQEIGLNSVSAIHGLSNDEASRGLPVAVDATVVYSRGYEHLLFVQDGDAGFFVSPPFTRELRTGDRIHIQGQTQGSFRPLVVADAITVLHHGTRPKPIPATFTDLVRATYDSELVTIKARVRAADLVMSAANAQCSSRMQLQMDGGHIEVNIDSCDEARLKQLLDDEVQITGVAAGKFDDKMQQTGVVLYVSSLGDLTIIKQIESDPWSATIKPMDKVLENYYVHDMTQRVHVRGTITYYQPGSAIVLQDGRKSIWIHTHTRAPLQIGDVAEATGFPDAHDRMLTLTDGELTDSQSQSPISPRSANWRELAFWDNNKPSGHQNDLVSIEGELIAEVREASRDEYVLSSEGKLFTAIYRHPRQPAVLPQMRKFPIGSRLRVTGICTILDTNAINPGEEIPFDILLRSFDDIAIAAGPPLLNERNLLFVAGMLALMVLGLGGRDWVLEYRLRRENARAAYVERRRGAILESINGARPLMDILRDITEFASLKLESTPCWCQIANGSNLGGRPDSLHTFRTVSEQIPARDGSSHGVMYAAFPSGSKPHPGESETLIVAARLAALAIENRQLYSDLQHRSEFDLLTEINNRFSFERFLDMQMQSAVKGMEAFGLIYLDLNRFKQVNDSYGHLVGDLYLREAALRMKSQLRPQDMLARLGGDEFAVVLPTVRSRLEVESIANRLQRAFDEPFILGEHNLQGSASVGFALYPEDGRNKDTLLSTADAAMYTNKQANRDLNAIPVVA
jgi:diguanylate cyclase (GGDEF)-like protein